MARASSNLYKLARWTRTAEAIERSEETGDPRYVERRAKNILLGRLLGRAGVWRRLWG